MANPLAGNIVATLLDKLGSDDDFRALFTNNPEAALKKAGASDADAKSCAGCLKVAKLASKDAIKASRQALTAQLTGKLTQTPIHLNAR
jgi:putative modified peptide